MTDQPANSGRLLRPLKAIRSFMPVLSIGIVQDCFYLLISYSEKFSQLESDVCGKRES